MLKYTKWQPLPYWMKTSVVVLGALIVGECVCVCVCTSTVAICRRVCVCSHQVWPSVGVCVFTSSVAICRGVCVFTSSVTICSAGWEYSTHTRGSQWGSSERTNHCARRRRWTRTRILVSDSAVQEERKVTDHGTKSGTQKGTQCAPNHTSWNLYHVKLTTTQFFHDFNSFLMWYATSYHFEEFLFCLLIIFYILIKLCLLIM